MVLKKRNVQLRLTFDSNLNDIVGKISLENIKINCSVTEGRSSLVEYLNFNNINFDENGDYFSFKIPAIEHLIYLIDESGLVMTDDLRRLYMIAKYRDSNSQYLIKEDLNDYYLISWYYKEILYSELFSDRNIKAFFYLNYKFTISDQLWEYLLSKNLVTNIIGRGTIKQEGYIEIECVNFSLLSDVKIDTLFRIQKNKVGLPLSEYDSIKKYKNIIIHDKINKNLRFNDNLDNLEDSGGIIVKINKKGYEKFEILKSIKEQDLLPVLIICNYENIPEWYTITRSLSIPMSSGDEGVTGVQIATYRELKSNKFFSSPTSIIYDEVDSYILSGQGVDSLKKFDGVSALAKVATVNNDKDVDSLRVVGSIVRPNEFSIENSIDFQYPVGGIKGFIEHISKYMLTVLNESIGEKELLSTSVISVDPGKKFSEILKKEILKIENKDDFNSYLSLVSSGNDEYLSPKLSKLVEYISLLDLRYNVAILVRDQRTLDLLLILLKPHGFLGDSENGTRIIRRNDYKFSTEKHINHIVIFDQFWNMEENVKKIKEFNSNYVTFFHLRDSIEDRITILSYLRAEDSREYDSNPPNYAEISFLIKN